MTSLRTLEIVGLGQSDGCEVVSASNNTAVASLCWSPPQEDTSAQPQRSDGAAAEGLASAGTEEHLLRAD